MGMSLEVEIAVRWSEQMIGKHNILRIAATAGLVTLLAGLLAACASKSATPPPGSLTLTLMVTNDTWGQLEPCG